MTNHQWGTLRIAYPGRSEFSHPRYNFRVDDPRIASRSPLFWLHWHEGLGMCLSYLSPFEILEDGPEAHEWN